MPQQPSMSWDFGPSRSEALDDVLRERSPSTANVAYSRKGLSSIHISSIIELLLKASELTGKGPDRRLSQQRRLIT